MYVYIDLAFIINFIFDAEILYILMKILSGKIILWRIMAAALMGGLQGVLFFFPYFRIISASPIGLLLPIIYVMVVLMPCNVKKCALGYIFFLTISFIFSGAMSLFGLRVFSGMLLVLPMYFIINAMRKQICIKKKQIKIFYKDKCIKCEGFYDSGNHTFYNGAPVIFGNKEIFSKLFGAEFSPNLIWNETENLCFVPYKTIGASGLAPGLRLDKVTTNNSEYKNIILGFYEGNSENEIILNGVML